MLVGVIYGKYGKYMVSGFLGDALLKSDVIWLVVEPPTPLKNDGVKVSWDDEIPNTLWWTNIAMENHNF